MKYCKQLLDKFCKWSGQKINARKSGIHISKNTIPSNRRKIKEFLHMRKLQSYAKYLGNPMFLARRRSKSFPFILDKLNNRLASWKSHCLSWAGRSMLINWNLANIPSFAMSLFKLPKKTDKIDGTNRKLWWGKPQSAQ